jgi:hypothetical protein
MALEAQGLHTIMWKWCPSDTYTQVGEIWNGPHPEDGMSWKCAMKCLSWLSVAGNAR